MGSIHNLLPIGANGSQVLVTTRSTRVATVMGIRSPYIVKGLNDEQSWELFENLAFEKGGEKMHAGLLAIGKDIVKMCKGVPLVITTLARVLSYKTEESHWLSIKNNKNLILLGDSNDVLPVLRLSYDNLPIHLKQCFGYCALFPKDYIFGKRELVQLWMAQGYIQPLHENERLEDVGDEYFEDLLSRSLFEKAEVYGISNDTLGYKMHDLIHDLAQSVVNSEVIIVTGDAKAIPKRVHHVSFFGLANQVPEDSLLMGKPIRTFLVSCDVADCNLPTNRYISSLKCSRVMKMDFIDNIPASLGEQSHLRYLDLSRGHFVNLPTAVTRLNHLQTLKLFNCRRLAEWPRNMKKLINLRHLEIDDGNQLRYMPDKLGELTQLQTLPFFCVGNEGMQKKGSMGGGLSELQFLNNLRGKLVIQGLSNVAVNGGGGREAILEGKQYIESLKLIWEKSMFVVSEETGVSVMESLQPHPNLKDLLVKNYGGVRFPNWMMNNGLDLVFPILVRIEMQNCGRCQVLPPLGQLPSLQYLRLEVLNAVEYMKGLHCPNISAASAKPFFPSLKKLDIYNMPRCSSNGWGKGPEVAAHEQPPPPPSYPYLEDLRVSNIKAELCLQLIICASPSLKSLWINQIKDDLSLAEEMPSLSNLHTLVISDCPYLSKRYRKKTGVDWPKISHILHVRIQ